VGTTNKLRLGSADIAQDMVATRARLSRALAVIDREYALRNLFVHSARPAAEGKGAPAVASALKRNAVPLSRVGIGIAWMAFANREDDILRRFKDAVGRAWRMLETPRGRLRRRARRSLGSRRNAVNRKIILGMTLALAGSLAAGASAQPATDGGDPAAGREFALQACTPCHVVSNKQVSPPRFAIAPSFDAIANHDTTTASGLHAFLSTPHPTMPNLILTPREQADVILYIMSLKR
jgi:mono/diheme cytochrome c family protein